MNDDRKMYQVTVQFKMFFPSVDEAKGAVEMLRETLNTLNQPMVFRSDVQEIV